MSVRVMTDPSCGATRRGFNVAIRFVVPGSKFGPVEVEIDTGTATTLMEEIQSAIDDADEAARRDLGQQASGARYSDTPEPPDDLSSYCGDCGSVITFDKDQYSECPPGAPCRVEPPVEKEGQQP